MPARELMMNTRIAIFSLALVSLVLPLRAVAEDIDLFVGRSTAATEAPNVLLILDNTANWGPDARFQAQKRALVSAFNSLPTGKINVGLMMFTETGAGDTGNKGAYVRAAIRPLDATYKAAIQRLLIGSGGATSGLDVNADKSNSGKAGLTMAEAYQYFLGGTGTWERPYAGNNKNKTDYTGNVYASSPDSRLVWALPGNALNSKGATNYNSPVKPNSCANNFIIYVGNGPAQDSSSDSAAAQGILQNQVGVSNIWQTANHFQLNPPGSETNMADEWAYFMYRDSPLDIKTYALDVNIVKNLNQCTNNTNGGWSAMMKNMSEVRGGGKYYPLCSTAFNEGQFLLNLTDAFNSILSRNSVFASVALPAAANQESTFLNQVYVGMFRPDAQGLPRWHGNLKHYKIALENNTLKIVDADGVGLVDTAATDNGGFVKGCARSFWTPVSETSPYYWDYLYRLPDGTLDPNAPQNCTGSPAGSNTPDGNIVEKGAQAYTLRANNPATRAPKVWTCNPTLLTCKADGLQIFSDANIPDDALGEAVRLGPSPPAATKAVDRTELINWAIGYDVYDENRNGSVVDMRPSAHGDIVHSQPVAVDYAGNTSSPEVVVFYGGNDGMLRAINGNQTTSHGSVSAGHEFWAFLPPEFYPGIKRLRDNTAKIRFPASGPTAGQGIAGTPKTYGMDGPLSAYELDPNNDNVIDERILFAGMRRAGRMIYSFDVTSRSTPTLNWRIGCPNLGDNLECTGPDWFALGQTWSRLSLTYAQGYDPNNDTVLDPLIVTGGGYDNCEDNDNGLLANHSCTSPKGNRIYVLDAATGNVVKWFPTDRSVPGNVSLVPVSDDDQKLMFMYAADTGGNVYRISGGTASPYAPAIIGSTSPSTWIITKIASLGCGTVTTCTANRKFLFGPDVIRIPNTDKFGILIGSGDREKPLTDFSVTYGVNNYFYSLVDQPTNATWLVDPLAPCGSNNLICQNALTTVATGVNNDNTLQISEKGWKLPLRAGEQVVTGSIVADNVANFSTHIPAIPQSCDAEYGEATAYHVNYQDAAGDTTQFLGGGLVPTPVAGKVIVCDASGNNCTPVPFCIGCGDEGSPIGAGKIGGSITWTQPRSRVFWNIDQVDD